MSGEIDGSLLANLVERYERLRDAIKALNEDSAELLKQIEGAGFDKKIFKAVVKRRTLSKGQRDEADTLIALYEQALGDFVHTPLGQASARLQADRSANGSAQTRS